MNRVILKDGRTVKLHRIDYFQTTFLVFTEDENNNLAHYNDTQVESIVFNNVIIYPFK